MAGHFSIPDAYACACIVQALDTRRSNGVQPGDAGSMFAVIVGSRLSLRPSHFRPRKTLTIAYAWVHHRRLRSRSLSQLDYMAQIAKQMDMVL